MALSLYIHYPFCVQKCSYCDFLSRPCDEDTRRAYLHALKTEINCAGGTFDQREPVDTIFFGGGTPSLIEPSELEEVLMQITDRFEILPEAEITLECNPGTATLDKLRSYYMLGINRLSIGIQSFHDDELHLLGRIHDKKTGISCYEKARKAGFDNINLDLISALPGQHYAAWMDNLQQAVHLHPEHISAYSLILEDGTLLKHMYENNRLSPLPDDEEDRRMYHDTLFFLQEYGYHRYEISNYARDGYECRHNLGYWSGHDYLGFGLGSASLMRNVRFHNISSLDHYLALCQNHTRCFGATDSKAQGITDPQLIKLFGAIPHLIQDIEPLTLQDQMGEFMWLGLRRTRGVSEASFEQRFHCRLMDIYGDIVDKHVQKGLLEHKNGMIYLTEYGTDISNYVMCDFV